MLIISASILYSLLLTVILLFTSTTLMTVTNDFSDHVSLLEPLKYYIPRATFLQVRHQNIPTCSMNAFGNFTFPCFCFPYPSDHYQLLIDNNLFANFSVYLPRQYFSSPLAHTACTPLIIPESHFVCEGVLLEMKLLYSPFHTVASESELIFNEVYRDSLENLTSIPCEYICLPGFYKIALMSNSHMIQVIFVKFYSQYRSVVFSIRKCKCKGDDFVPRSAQFVFGRCVLFDRNL